MWIVRIVVLIMRRMITSEGKQEEREERKEQAALVAYLRWLGVLFSSFPNDFPLAGVAASRRYAVINYMKRLGLTPGMPDLCLFVARRGYHGMVIEMKSRGGRVREEQREVLARLEAEGYYVVVAHGFQEAREHVDWYLGLEDSG